MNKRALGAEFDESAGHLIRRAHQISDAIFAAELAHFELTPPQFAALIAIRDGDDPDATRVAQAIALDRSTVGNVLERMEAKGWIARAYRSNDKRTKRIALTVKGRALLREIAPAIKRSRERFLGVLGPAEQATLRRLLGTLIALHEGAQD